MTGPVRRVLQLAGKSDAKVAAVFGSDPATCHKAVTYVRQGAPGIPVWLFSTAQPDSGTAALCQSVEVRAGTLALVLRAQRALWPYWVALGVTAWTGERGRLPLKWAPFFIPPFRALILNEHGDFLPGTPVTILRHATRRIHDAVQPKWQYLGELMTAYWHLASYHSWQTRRVRTIRDKVSAIGLLLAGTVLRLTGFPNRRRFEWVHGTDALDIACEPAAGDQVLRMARWNPIQSERAMKASSARWVLWQEQGDDKALVAEAAPLFDDPRTFAVSRQSNFRAWKPMMFATAPFRALQPGEVTRVLAPLGGSVLFDRRKLLALGMPESGLAGAAWMVFFWKAAAAGWRSYSVAAAQPLREQPDLPAQEAGFIWRLWRDHSLRRLGPRDPDLSRGNISTIISVTGAEITPRLKVLLVSPFLPFPLSHGGAVRIYNLCRCLADRVDFFLLSFHEKGEAIDYPKLREIFRDVYVVDQDERPANDDQLPLEVRQYQSSAMQALIAEKVRDWSPDLLQIEYTQLAEMRDAAPELPAVLVEHDLTFSLYRQLAEKNPADPAAQREYQRWLAFERRWLADYDLVWTVSEEDRQTAIRETERPADRTFAIANGVDIDRFTPRDQPSDPPEILYVGSFRHLPNWIGFENLRRNVMPRIWNSRPDVHLRVVAGPRHEQFWKGDRRVDGRIQIHGFVEDLRPLYARATVVVIPLEVSAGTNIKVMEAMACGKAVVSTPVGCAGLDLRDGRDARIVAGWTEFADATLELLGDPELRARLAAEARRTVEERFSWESIAESAYASYLAVARLSRSVA
jgi:glycosyltransferase involved in cell wall biosynthesis